MEKRLLVFEPPGADTLRALQAVLQKHNSDPSLPGSEDPSDDDTVLHISGPYSQAAIKVWLDEQQSDFSDQISEYLAPAAADVMRAIGALILVVSPDHEPERLVHQIRSVSRLIEAVGGGYEWDGAQIVLHANLDTPMARELREPVEDACAEALFEFIDLAESGVNEFREKLGGERLHEVLQSVSWEENRLSDRSDAEDSLENGGRFDTDLEAFDTLLKQLSLIKDNPSAVPLAKRREIAESIARLGEAPSDNEGG